MSAKKSAAAPDTGLAAVFDAIEALTFREMGQLADLLHLQSEGRDLTSPHAFAQLLADASESFDEAEAEAA